jgi:pimeloyl-ACP methyl ester carboxylesterase
VPCAVNPMVYSGRVMPCRWQLLLGGIALALLIGSAVAPDQLASAGAGGLLHPARRPVVAVPPASCQDSTLTGDGMTLKGWRCSTSTVRRGTLVYLHGIADNRTSAAGVIERFGKRGFDVVAYDSRAHGESPGDVCTYGYFEKQDLHRVLDTVARGPIVLLGISLGAAVALQEAAQHPRISAIVAAETFSDLRSVATERAPFFSRPASSSGRSSVRSNMAASTLPTSAPWLRRPGSIFQCC